MAAQFATEAGDGPMDNALWRYALSVYSRPGVESLLLRLQDEHGEDILLILAALWLAENQQELTEGALVLPEYIAWRDGMIRPVRQQRRLCEGPEQRELYELLKKAELEAERYGLGLLWSALKDCEAASDVCGMNNLVLCCSSDKECSELIRLAGL